MDSNETTLKSMAAISLDPDNIRTLGTYRLSRDGLALNYRINVNTKHLADRGDADVLETLCHEQVHEWEHIGGRTKGGQYHTRAFRDKAEQIGIPVDRNGVSVGPIIDSPFIHLLAEHGVDLHIPPTPAPRHPQAQPRSTISPWTCSCTRVWVARRTELEASCGKCGERFVRA
jgi:predicted SprT family Zn-dependent metalloprotease